MAGFAHRPNQCKGSDVPVYGGFALVAEPLVRRLRWAYKLYVLNATLKEMFEFGALDVRPIPLFKTICARGAYFLKHSARMGRAERRCDDCPMFAKGPMKDDIESAGPQRSLPPSSPGTAAVLAAAAFGAAPGMHPLPAAHDVEQRWHRAVALGGQGRYAAARAELSRLRREVGPTGAWASLVASTEASLLRQLGGHRVAAASDGRALAAVGTEAASHGDPENRIRCVRARCDALTGLAADSLGTGGLAASRDLLTRCTAVLDEAEDADGDAPFLRQRIRLAWVSAETALAGGDFSTARVFADRAAALASRYGSVRHTIKSDLIRAASLTGDVDSEPARELAREVFDRCAEHGLIPLRWAAAMMLAGVGGSPEAVAAVNACAATIVRRGGRFVPMGV